MKFATAIAACCIAGLALTSCSSDTPDAQGADSSADESAAASATKASDVLVAGDKYTACAPTDQAPFSYTEGDKTVGFDVDVATTLGQVLGSTVATVTASKDDILSGKVFADRTCDFAVGALSLSAATDSITFTDAYYQPTQAMLVKVDSDIKDSDGLAKKAVAVVEGSTAQDWVKENISDATIKPFPELAAVIKAVSDGDVDGAFHDSAPLMNVTKDSDALKVPIAYDTGEVIGLAVAQDNTQVLDALNLAMQQLIQSEEFNAIIIKWFGGQQPA